MITFTQGNLLKARAEALVNTVNTVGVMGKGIALMFKERFADNYRQYQAACKAGEVHTGKMFVTGVSELDGPRWIVNFLQSSIGVTLQDRVGRGGLAGSFAAFSLRTRLSRSRFLRSAQGNGGLNWGEVRKQIEAALGDLETEILVFEPVEEYQNVAKRQGTEKLTPARALIAELVRRYWVLGIECSLLEIPETGMVLGAED